MLSDEKRLTARLIAIAFLLIACGGSGDGFQIPTPGPGVVFTYPVDGQLDVPVGARIIIGLTDPVDAAVGSGCVGGPMVSAFCVVGPNGPLTDVAVIVGANANVIQFESADFEPGQNYDVFVRPPALRDSENLPDSEPLLSFRTRSRLPLGGQPPTLIGVNGEPAAVFLPGSELTPKHAFVDFAPIRLLFSEPIDPSTIELGTTLLVTTDGGSPIPGVILADGIHVTFDPNDDFTGGQTVRIQLTAGIIDTGGEAFAPVELTMVPADTRGTSGLIPQVLRTFPGSGDMASPISRFSGGMVNLITIEQTLIGSENLQIIDSALESQLADPTLFGGPMHLVIRRGQLIKNANLDISFGGEVPAGLSTGQVNVQFVSDATGVLFRNPYRDPGQIPDDDSSPVFVQLTFDIAITAADFIGHGVMNQTIMHVQTSGAATITDGSLVIETVGAMELDLLGVTKASANLVLQLATDPDRQVEFDQLQPRLISTYPADGLDDFPVRDAVVLLWDEALDLSIITANSLSFEDNTGTAVDFTLQQAGAALLLRPRQRLAYDTSYTVTYGELRDYAGNLVSSSSNDAAGGDMMISFSTPTLASTSAPPAVAAIHPGAPCALTDASSTTPGRCVSGDGGDDLYKPFTIFPEEPIETYFNQPMQSASIRLGSSCGDGSVRVELTDGTSCTGVVPGTLLVREAGFKFVPNQPWSLSQAYRLVLHAGSNDSCDADELCGRSGEALNTNPLQGNENGDGGGNDIVIDFIAVEPAVAGNYVPTIVTPFTDSNGNGFVDSGEIEYDQNRAAVQITGTSGLVTDATIQGEDCAPNSSEVEACMYLSGTLPVRMEEPIQNCVIGSDALGNSITVATCIPVTLSPQAMYATSIEMDADLLGIGLINDLPTGQTILRVRDDPNGPLRAFIYQLNGSPVLRTTLDLYMDAPDLSIPLANHDLVSKAISVTLEGPVQFFPDGRIQIQLVSLTDIDLTVGISALGIGVGGIDLRIAAGEMRLQLMGRPLRGGEL